MFLVAVLVGLAFAFSLGTEGRLRPLAVAGITGVVCVAALEAGWLG